MRAAGLTAAALLAVGCGAPTECPDGARCNQPPSTAFQLAAELTPSEKQSTVVRQEVMAVAFASNGSAMVTLLPRLDLRGKVVAADGTPISAQLLLRRRSLIPGAADVLLQTTTSSGENAGAFAFQTVDAPKLGRVITVLPETPFDALYAPQTVALEEVTPGSEVTITLPPPDLGLRIEGWVGTALDDGKLPVEPRERLAGVRVWAVDPTTREARSSATVTGPGGEFRLHLAPQVGARDRVRIVATPDAATTLPVLERDVAAVDDPLLDKVGKVVGARTVLRMPALPLAQRFSLPLSGRSPSGAMTPVANARVDFSVDLSQGNEPTRALLHRSAVSDERGVVSLDLVPGDRSNRIYSLLVTPADEAPFARSKFELPVGAVGGVLGTTELPLRALLRGRIVAPDGQPVRGALVSARASRSVEGQGQGENSGPSAVTGPDGAFALRLDRGTYDIECVPPPALPLTRWSIDNRVVGEGETDLATISLPGAVVTRLVVRDGRQALVGDVAVRIYSLAFAKECPAGRNSCPLPPRLRAEGMTGRDGAASLVLPAP